MKNLVASIIVFLTGIVIVKGQCTANYSLTGASIDSVVFNNLSTVSNAHYYWNFGDGSGSNAVNPFHIFPDDGEYLVTLYAYDTISNCASVYESWIAIIKPDTIPCNVFFTDTIFGTTFQTLNISTACFALGLDLNCNVMGPGLNYCGPNYLDPQWGSTIFLHGMEAFTNDSINGYGILKEYYRTAPFQFNSSINYQNCSPNFEVIIDYQANGALVSMTAMNKTGVDTFWITGFGNPIALAGHSVSFLYPYISYRKNFPHLIQFQKTDSANSCVVKGTQEILVNNPFYTLPPNCSISLQPQTQTVNSGSIVQFIVSANSGVSKQWQQDAGLGFMNLTNAGAYSGVNADTLTISNVQLTMNNYHYRCVLTGNPGGCHNTSSPAILNVQIVGVNELELQNINIFPNPASDQLTILIPITDSRIKIQIFNMLGESERYIVLSEDKSNINISDLPKGVFIIEIQKGNEFVRGKFVKR